MQDILGLGAAGGTATASDITGRNRTGQQFAAAGAPNLAANSRVTTSGKTRMVRVANPGSPSEIIRSQAQVKIP